MTTKILALVSIFGLMVVAEAVIPEGYIMQVTPVCGADAIEDATIRIVTDLNLHAKAMCAGGISADFTTSDDVNFNLQVSYPNQGSQACVFRKRQNALVFAVKVVVSYGEVGNLVHQEEEEYTVSCTFSPKGSDETTDQNVIEGLIAPTEIQSNMGTNSTSTFTLQVIDVLGGSLEGVDLALGRTVQLKVETSGDDGEVGIRPVSCVAIDGNARYSILRAGCGDGIIFNKTRGFITTGRTAVSPYFDAFSINAGAVINFQCNFVTCDTNCDGCSCGELSPDAAALDPGDT